MNLYIFLGKDGRMIMAVTITDVANEAGVSKSTVSKVINHWTTISPETAARVNAAIEKLHYTPNSRAVSCSISCAASTVSSPEQTTR